MPLTAKGEKIMSAMKKEYGEKKGEEIFYASKNAGKISGVDSARTDMSEPEWDELRKLLSEWLKEEAEEPEHKADASPAKKLDMLLKGVGHLHRKMMRADAALGGLADRLERNDADGKERSKAGKMLPHSAAKVGEYYDFYDKYGAKKRGKLLNLTPSSATFLSGGEKITIRRFGLFDL